jgi:hypothetical protein
MINIGISVQIECIRREIRRRKKYYPLLVEGGKMSQEDVDQELAVMRSVMETLTQLRGMVKGG